MCGVIKRLVVPRNGSLLGIGSRSKTSIAAPAIFFVLSAAVSACISIIGARDVFTR